MHLRIKDRKRRRKPIFAKNPKRGTIQEPQKLKRKSNVFVAMARCKANG